MHDHSHSAHRGHHHHVPHGASGSEQRALRIALVLTAGFAVIEAAGGWWAGSLALLSDAGHMVTDVAALAIALFAQHLAARPPSRRASYGYARAEVIAAFSNALIMLAVVGWIAFEAVRRLLSPAPVSGGIVIAVAAAGLAANMLCAWLLSRGRSLNSRAALVHVLGDMAGSVAALVSGAVIAATGWVPIDPLLSLFVAVLILYSTWLLLKAAMPILMQGVPAHLSYDEIGGALARVPGVTTVHDLHVWHMTSERAALSAHLVIRDAAEWPETLAAAQRLLAERFGIDHVTLQPAWRAPIPGKRVIPVLPVSVKDKPSMH
jgi:cobalt-zinc-cadmium efflux system protein